MSKNVFILLQEISRQKTSSASRLDRSFCKCFSSIIPEKSIINPINSSNNQKEKQQLSSKKQRKIFVLYTILWSRLINPVIYLFTPGIKTVDKLAKLNDFRTFNAFGSSEGGAVQKTSVAPPRCLENPKRINVKNKLKIDDYVIEDPFRVVNTGIKSKVFWGSKIKYSSTSKIEGLPNVGFKSILYNITLKKLIEAKIERMMPNINQGELSYLCDLRAQKVDKNIAYVEEKIEPIVHEIKDSLKKVASELNKVAEEVGKENVQGSMNLTASLDIIGAELKIFREKITKKPEEKKNNNLKIKIVTLAPPQHTKARQNIIKHSLNIKSPISKHVTMGPLNTKDNELKRLHKINSAPFEQNKLDNRVTPKANGNLKEKLMPSNNVAETSQLYANSEALKQIEIGDKDLKATILKKEKSILENKNINFIQPETKPQQFTTAVEKNKVNKVDNDKCLATAFNKNCNSELKDERGSSNKTNERSSSLESLQQMQPEGDSNKDMDKIEGKTADSQKSDNTNEVDQQTNEAVSDNVINFGCKNAEGDLGKEINNTEDGEHTAILSGEETDGIETEQENVNSLKCQSTEDNESGEDVPSRINEALVDKAHPEECLSTELVSFNTAGEEGVFKTQKEIIGSDNKGKLIDMNTVLVQENRGTQRNTDAGNAKSISREHLKNSMKNLGSLETMTPKNTSNLEKSTLKPWKRIKESEDNMNSLKTQIKSGYDGMNRRDISKQYTHKRSASESTDKNTSYKLQSQKTALKINSIKIKVPGKALSLDCVESKMKQTDTINTKTGLELQNNSISDKKTQLIDAKTAQSITTVKEHKDTENIKVKLKTQSKRGSELKIKPTKGFNAKNKSQIFKTTKSKDDTKQTVINTSGIKDNTINEKMSTIKKKTESVVVKKPSEKHMEKNNAIQQTMKVQKTNSVKDTKSLTQLSKSEMSLNKTKSMEGPKNAVIKDNVLNKQEQKSKKVISKNKINKEISKSKSDTKRLNISKPADITLNRKGEKSVPSNLNPNKEIKEEIKGSTNRLLLKKLKLKHENISDREISRMPYQNRADKGNELTKESRLKPVTNQMFNDTSKDNKVKKEKYFFGENTKEHLLVGKDKKLHQNLDFNTNKHNSLGPKINQPDGTANQKKKFTEKTNGYQTLIKLRNSAMITPISRYRDKIKVESLNQNDESKKKLY